MSRNLRRFITGLFTIAALVLVIAGLVTEIYLISVGGLALILFMLLERTLHIRRLNKQIEAMKENEDLVSKDPEK
ncbi:MAG: hypothetical protein U5N26_08520 [Candidatus Marinimicrobia bacterium]|nr:hypothetical protein [Candidatus Neomarinimicrobiota bacterium]